jgi:hypothetical protein
VEVIDQLPSPAVLLSLKYFRYRFNRGTLLVAQLVEALHCKPQGRALILYGVTGFFH